MVDERKDDRWKVDPASDTRAAVSRIVRRTGRKRPDVLREALGIGVDAIEQRYTAQKGRGAKRHGAKSG